MNLPVNRQTQPPVHHGLAPVISADCCVLVLGSMPGIASITAGQYYAHPQNLFWPMMAQICQFDLALPYAQRLHRLTAAGIGLWDVLAACKRDGSLDSAIDRGSECDNPIAELLITHCSIRCIALNGGKAAQLFDRHVVKSLPTSRLSTLTIMPMPSTSPANASQSLSFKTQSWLQVRDWLCA